MLVQQNSLTILINKVLGQSAKQRKGGSQLLYHCPFCKESKTIPKMEICLDQNDFGRWHCWICNAKGGSITQLFRKVKANRSYLIELYSITKDEDCLKKRKYTRKKREDEIVLPSEFKPMCVPSNDPEYRNALRYLKGRGITRDDILRYNIGYCEDGEYRNRIVIPSYDAEANLNYFVTRTYYNSVGLKYKNCPYSKDIVGFELFVNWDEPITLLEGPFDGISVRRNAIPLFGKIMSQALKEALIDNGVTNVNVCLDNDAMRDALYISEFLVAQGIEVNLIKMGEKDPSVMGFESINSTINSSKTLEFYDILSMKMST